LPIFVCYVNIDGLSRERSLEKIDEIKKDFNYSNMNIFFVTTTTETRIECIYGGDKPN
jgi:hypothetical protein